MTVPDKSYQFSKSIPNFTPHTFQQVHDQQCFLANVRPFLLVGNRHFYSFKEDGLEKHFKSDYRIQYHKPLNYF